MSEQLVVGLVSISDRASTGIYEDKGIPALQDWMARHDYASVDQFRGLLAVPSDVDADAVTRAGYVAALENARRVYGSIHR